MIGVLGNAAFSVSSDRVFTFSGFSRSGSPRIEEHAIIGRKPVNEYIGPGLDQVILSIRMDTFLGVNPKSELDKLREAMTLGQVLPLIVGGDYLGRWSIISLNEDHRRHDGQGRLLVAEATLTLREVPEDAGI